MSYTPNLVPQEYSADFMRRELERIRQGFVEYEASIGLKILHAAPDRIRPGQLIYADGTDYDPGSGAGVYRRNEANSAWVFLG